MSSSIEQYLLHSALRCGLGPDGPAAYRQQLFFVANRDLGSHHHQNDFQRALETAVDKRGLFENHGGKGSGEYRLTREGYEAATACVGAVEAKYAPTSRDRFRVTLTGAVVGASVRIETRAVKCTVFIGGAAIRSAKEACRRIEVLANVSLPTDGDSAVRVLQDFAIDRLFEIEFR